MLKKYRYFEGLTSLKFSAKGTLINYLGQIKDVMGNDLPRQRDSEGHWCVDVDSWNGFGSYKIIDLVAIQYKELNLPLELLPEVVTFCIDGDKENVSASNVGYRFKSGKLEHPDYPGFYYIPGFMNYGIDEMFDLIRFSTGRKNIWYVSEPIKKKNIKGGYYSTKVRSVTGKFTTVSRHRCALLAFSDYPDDCDTLVVNHIDGVPGNDNLGNLEWVTRSGNNLHAVATGLRSQNLIVLARNVITEDITEFFSIAETARVLGYPTDETIRLRLINKTFCKVYSDGYQFKLKDDPREWIIPDDPLAAITAADQNRPVSVRSCRDYSVTEYKAISTAEKALGVKHGAFALRVSTESMKPIYGYQVRPLEDTREWEDFDHVTALLPPESSAKGIDVINLYTNETLSFPSVAQAVKEINYFHAAEKLRKGEQPLSPGGWKFKYSTDEWETFPVDVEKYLYENQKEISARDPVSKKVYIANSSRELSRILGLDPKAIRAAALKRGEALYHGYQFRLGITSEDWPVINI